MTWLTYFLFTQIIEIPIYGYALRGRVAVAFGASAITHPIVWFVFPRLIDSWWPMVLAAESFAVIAEAIWLRAFGLRRALAWSLAANGASFLFGLLWSAL
jgi:hypothetical protein